MLTVFRKEIKYLIPAEFFYLLYPQLCALMTPDTHGDCGTYNVRSLYFDSLDDRDLQDNLFGVMEKRKIRLRVYSPEDRTAKLEYKCKSGSDSTKYSLELDRADAVRMEEHHYECLLDRQEELALFLYTKMSCNVYTPKTLIEYKRTAFTYPVSNVRVTFDHEICAGMDDRGLFSKDPFLTPTHRQDTGILEVKYDDFLPSPIKEVIGQVDRIPEANSKYSMARLL